jgi:hypothetical protein
MARFLKNEADQRGTDEAEATSYQQALRFHCHATFARLPALPPKSSGATFGNESKYFP